MIMNLEDGDDSGNWLRPWEHRSSLRKEVPKSFDMLCKQIIKISNFIIFEAEQGPRLVVLMEGKEVIPNIHDAGARDEMNNTVLATGSIQPLLSHYRPCYQKQILDQSQTNSLELPPFRRVLSIFRMVLMRHQNYCMN